MGSVMWTEHVSECIFANWAKKRGEGSMRIAQSGGLQSKGMPAHAIAASAWSQLLPSKNPDQIVKTIYDLGAMIFKGFMNIQPLRILYLFFSI